MSMNKVTISRFPSLAYTGQEALNTLCTNLSFSGVNIKKIMITSSHESEGKTFMSMNIMRTMAKFGKRVALVDADLRRSNIAGKYFLKFEDEQKRFGLAHYLAGIVDLDQVIYETNIENFWMVPVGRTVTNSMPLLNSRRFATLLNFLADKVDYVIVDVPPTGVVVDSSEIAKSCDGILLVVDYDRVHGKEFADVKNQLEQTGCPILGAVLNQVKMNDFMSKKYYYRSKYGYYTDYRDK